MDGVASKASGLPSIQGLMEVMNDIELDGVPGSPDGGSKKSALKLKRALFKELDISKTGRLGSVELYAFAKDVLSYSDTHQTWLKEVYFYLCVDVLKVDPSEGVYEAAFSHLLDALLDRFGEAEHMLMKCVKRLRTEESRKAREDEARTSRDAGSRIHWNEVVKSNRVSAQPPLPQQDEVPAGQRRAESTGAGTVAQITSKSGTKKVEAGPSRKSSVAGDDASTTADTLSQTDSVASTLTDQLLVAAMDALPPVARAQLAHHGIPDTPLTALLVATSWDSNVWQGVVPTDEDTARWKACQRDLQNLVDTCFTDGTEVDVAVFGSMVSGFGTKLSDLDVVLLERQEDPHAEKRVTQMKILEIVERAMSKQQPKWRVKAIVPHARIPILTVAWTALPAEGKKLEVDISVNNRAPVQNTRLLKAYADCSPCVARLVVLVKYWANMCGISGASSGNLSPYALTLMVIYFLQVFSFEPNGGGTLPVLSADMEKGSKWQPSQTLTRVLGSFFMFYGGLLPGSFIWGEEVVSVRVGRRRKRADEVFAKLHRRMDDRIHIEDPIELHRNLHDVLKQDREQILFEAFQYYGNWPVWYMQPLVPQPMTPFGLTPLSPPFGATIMPPYTQLMLDDMVQAQQQLLQQDHHRRQQQMLPGRAHMSGHTAANWSQEQKGRPHPSGYRFASAYNAGERKMYGF